MNQALDEIVIPLPKKDELICEYCLTIAKKKLADGWMYFAFSYLSPTWLCNTCAIEKGSELQNIQFMGRTVYVESEISTAQ